MWKTETWEQFAVLAGPRMEVGCGWLSAAAGQCNEECFCIHCDKCSQEELCKVEMRLLSVVNIM